jgi:hypothetical protein
VPTAAVLVLIMFDDDSVFAAMRAGASCKASAAQERRPLR